MYSKLCALFALAVATQATADHQHQHQHHARHHYPSGGVFPPSGSVAGSVAPFPTGGPTQGVFPTGTAAGSGGASAPAPTSDSTLTYTITVQGHTSVITTTIHHTNYHTDFVYAQQSEAANEKDVNQGSVTETLHLTSTSTHFVTQYASGTGAPGAEEKDAAGGNGAGNGGCAAPSTVTVQGPEVTVTVTAPAEGAANTGGVEEKTPETQGPGAGSEGAGSEIPPYPIPSSKKSKTKCASTGFITKSAKGTASGAPLPTGSGGLKYPVPAASAPIEKVKMAKK